MSGALGARLLDEKGFAAAVQARLVLGERLYGDAYLDRDNIAEALEEAYDLAIYCDLERRRLEQEGRLSAAVAVDLTRTAELAELAAAVLERAAQARDMERAA